MYDLEPRRMPSGTKLFLAIGGIAGIGALTWWLLPKAEAYAAQKSAGGPSLPIGGVHGVLTRSRSGPTSVPNGGGGQFEQRHENGGADARS